MKKLIELLIYSIFALALIYGALFLITQIMGLLRG